MSVVVSFTSLASVRPPGQSMLTKNGAAGTERYGTYVDTYASRGHLTGRECVHHEQLSRRSVPADLSAEGTTTKRFFFNLEFARNTVMLQHSSSRRTGCLDRNIFLKLHQT